MVYVPLPEAPKKTLLGIQVYSKLVTALTGVLAFSGCSVDDHGMVAVTYKETETSRTRHVVATGLHFETRGPMAGLSLGFLEILNTRLKVCSRLEPRLYYQSTVGLQFTTSNHEVGLTLGRRETLLAAPGGSNSASAVRFDPNHPEQTTVVVRPEPRSKCQNQNLRGT